MGEGERIVGQERIFNQRYRVVDVLGEGGMAHVYKAVDERLGRVVALKALQAQYHDQPTVVARFEQEARLAAGLSHPAIIGVHDVGRDDDGTPYIVMEYVEGETLRSLIEREAPLAVPHATAICHQLCAALDDAHQRGIVHRDIKPDNIFVTPAREVKVGDFGIARARDSVGLTTPGMVLGSVFYFAPEQAQGQLATAQSDLYSTGIVLYEMLTGRRPFVADNALAVAMKQVAEAPVPPSHVNPRLSPGVDAVVLRALAKDPAQRYRSGMELAGALARAGCDAAIAAAAEVTADPHRRRATTPGAAAVQGDPRPGTGAGRPPGGGRAGRRTGPPLAPSPLPRGLVLFPLVLVLVLLGGLAGGATASRLLERTGQQAPPSPPTRTIAAARPGGGGGAAPIASPTSTATQRPTAASPTAAAMPNTATAPATAVSDTATAPATVGPDPATPTTVRSPTGGTAAGPVPVAAGPAMQVALPAGRGVQASLTIARGITRAGEPVEPTDTFSRSTVAYAIAAWHGPGPRHTVSFRWTTPLGTSEGYSLANATSKVVYAWLPLHAPGSYHVALYVDNRAAAQRGFTVVASGGMRPSAPPSSAPPTDVAPGRVSSVQAQVMAAVQDANNVYMQVMNTRDTSRLSRVFGPALVAVNQAVAARLAAHHQHWRITLIALAFRSVRLLGPDRAQVSVVKTESAALVSDSGRVLRDQSTYTLPLVDILERVDGRWLVEQVLH